jgi:hypothetical protein
MNQVPEYEQLQSLGREIRKAKTKYLRQLISLGYVFEKKGSYSDAAYWAIHKDYWRTEEERWDEDFDGTVTPDYFPKGAFIRIDTLAESETEDPWETDYFLSEHRCYLDYLN